jgi:hypothetical protein
VQFQRSVNAYTVDQLWIINRACRRTAVGAGENDDFMTTPSVCRADLSTEYLISAKDVRRIKIG